MNPEQLAEFRRRLAANRQPGGDKLDPDKYAFPRGWNECHDFVERCLRDILSEKNPNEERAST